MERYICTWWSENAQSWVTSEDSTRMSACSFARSMSAGIGGTVFVIDAAGVDAFHEHNVYHAAYRNGEEQ